MATYVFSAIAGTTLAGFNPATDTIQFATPAYTAGALSLYQDGANAQVSCNGSYVYLAGVTVASLGGVQFAFADGSMFRQAPAAGATLVGAGLADQLLGGTGSDVLRGQGGDDTLRGGDGSGNDLLVGGNGNDYLDAYGAGLDTLAGGLGDDFYRVDAGDKVQEAAEAGIDTVVSKATWTLASDLENLYLETGAGAINGYGNAAGNFLYGNDAGNRLEGLDGNDWMYGKEGNDTLLGGSGDDFVRGDDGADLLTGGDGYDSIEGGAGIDTMAGGEGTDYYYVQDTGDVVVDAGQVGNDKVWTYVDYKLPANVERIEVLGNAAVDITGNGMGNNMIGNAAANQLDGGLGDDWMAGEAGNDTYLVDSAGDMVYELAGGGIDYVIARVSFSLANTDGAGGNQVEKLRLAGTAAIDGTGNAAANTIYANDGVNRIDGGAGVDTLSYAYTGGSGPAGVTLDLGAVNGMGEAIASGASSADVVKNVENLGGSKFADQFTGDAKANLLDGRDGNDTLSGGGGNDVLVGGAGADQLQGGSGADIFRLLALADTGTTAGTRDVITDFVAGLDRIDLSALDANDATGTDNAFSFIGNAGFSAAGQLRYVYDAGTGTGVLSGSTDADTQAEFAIQLTGVAALSASDFLL